MAAYQLITDAPGLNELMGRLRGEAILALDTEASGFHRYRERLCLIQLSTRERTYLIDPLVVTDVSVLGTALADPAIEWVIHDADYDLRMLKKLGSFRAANVFDTFVAAELLNEPELSLAAMLQKHFGVTLNKKFQKADWSQRPLSEEMLAYAAMDTTHLIALRDILKQKLIDKGRWSWAQEEFELLVKIPFETVVDDEPGFLRIKGAKALKPRQLAILRELHGWREGLAEKLDRAPFMVLGNEVMLQASREPPHDIKDFAARKGVGETLVQRNGAAIMQAVQRGMALPREQWPHVPRPKRWDRDPEFDERFERLRKVREQLMREHDLQPGIVSANHILSEIARNKPRDLAELTKIAGMRNWQVHVFGEALLSAV